MSKLAVIIYTDVGGKESLGRVMNALESAKEYKENGDPVRLIFDGAGTRWVPELEDESHRLHTLYRTVRDESRVCDYCAESFGVHDQVIASGVEIIDEYEGHVSIRSLVERDYEIMTF